MFMVKMVKFNVFILLFGEYALLSWIRNMNQLFEEKEVFIHFDLAL